MQDDLRQICPRQVEIVRDSRFSIVDAEQMFKRVSGNQPAPENF